MQKHPNYVLIDSSVLTDDINHAGVYDPSAHRAGLSDFPGIDPQYAFTLSGVSQNATTFPAVPLWVVGLQGKVATKVTVIGIVGNSDAAHYGLYVSKAAYGAKNIGIVPGSSIDPQSESYYFKVAPGQDAHALSLKLGSAYLDDGLETTALADIIWQARGPRILLSDVLLAVVGLTLLLGVAALALTGTRAVIERRQQIGMLRAMGSPRSLIQCAFLLESFLIGTAGSLLGIALGLLLARNIFAANFFEQYQTGLAFSIPYPQLALIVVISLLASFLGAILPAWQAGRVAPAEALRYT
jgi:putative ABC transport system permease protein